ncbi:23S rRNA (cytidine1920-2'-O)/16S rRNA (cytidine1409-2'-O)-methyltransferase [Desulfotomaculum arcticum]|uniref:23S rRNA (Cytidine1920-2'-O)/16S rRNA (Cytidine1409-2'-O)-methyltransferase n=1 Tax=Desulfotruncus arcticus DSM 17038 TaxID=1121424 RepID=A0A1I2MWN8_9FIRM|nr:TlyA family RNA methyltransferase [Desulfotruncus arcticus]SFF93756.1 23S rRNA (cytidine1920-2'-O)/16S rRNA (cytidine1409-2'-O)-methyltransferase [Desulfotomaculum arcticum] [Desulfotruncus arcticus DSM 17038]
MTEKKRIDLVLVEKGFFPSREQARAAIMAGEVTINGMPVDKPGQKVTADPDITVRAKLRYVSRGGLKLEKALQVFAINLQGRVILDIGASTGGFTDCALQNGARYVYAVDVGYGQIAWSLRNDPRVGVLERTNIRYLEKDVFKSGMPDFITIDVSFISLCLVLPRADFLLGNYEGVALVKPQFEAGREKVGKKGVVKDPAVHRDVLKKVINCLVELNCSVLGLDYSPVKGPEGNIEYLLHFQKGGQAVGDNQELIDAVVQAANNNLDLVNRR